MPTVARGETFRERIEKDDAWRPGYPLPPGAFLEVLILIDFKSFAPEVVIPKGLKWRFSEVLILEVLRVKRC